MASRIVTPAASTSDDDEIAALREELARARRQRTRRQADGASAAAQSSVPGTLAPAITAQPNPAQSPQVPSQNQEDLRKALITLVRTLGTTDPDFLDKVVRAVKSAEDRSFIKNLVASIILSTIFLIAGWLLSIVATPATMTTIFRH